MTRRPFVVTPEQVVLAFLGQNAHRSYFSREVCKETGLSRGGVNTALRALAKNGLLHVEARGRMRFYRANLDDPRVRSFKLLIRLAELAPLVRRVARHSQRVVLFGSAAEGRDIPESDTDLLIVTNHPDRVQKLLPGPYRKLQAVVLTPVGFAEMEKKDPTFAGEVKKGIVVWEEP